MQMLMGMNRMDILVTLREGQCSVNDTMVFFRQKTVVEKMFVRNGKTNLYVQNVFSGEKKLKAEKKRI